MNSIPLHLLQRCSWRKTFAAVSFDWAIIFICWWLMINTHYLLYPLWGLIIAGRLHGFGAILHDLCHMDLQKKSWRFRLLEIMTGYFIGSSADAMAYHHLPHHKFVMARQDPYFKINKKCTPMKRFLMSIFKGSFLVPFWIIRSLTAPLALVMRPYRSHYARIFLQEVNSPEPSKDEIILKCAREDLPIAVFHLALMYITLTQVPILFYGYYLLLPAAGIICIYRLLIEHEYDGNENKTTLLNSTSDHHLSSFDKILFGPHQIGLHYIHHLHPQVGFHALPELQRWYLTHCQEYQKKYWAL